jgi:hypothetical protein
MLGLIPRSPPAKAPEHTENTKKLVTVNQTWSPSIDEPWRDENQISDFQENDNVTMNPRETQGDMSPQIIDVLQEPLCIFCVLGANPQSCEIRHSSLD